MSDHRWPRYSYDGSRLYLTRNEPMNGRTNEVVVLSVVTGAKQLTTSSDNSLADEVLRDGVPGVVYSKRLGKGDHLVLGYRPDGLEEPLKIFGDDPRFGSLVAPRGPGAKLVSNEVIAVSVRAATGSSALWRVKLDGSDAVRLTTEEAWLPDWWVPRASFLGRFLDSARSMISAFS